MKNEIEKCEWTRCFHAHVSVDVDTEELILSILAHI
jgi:hypothetical protein